MATTSVTEAPWDKGSLQHHPSQVLRNEKWVDPEWKPNKPFSAVMRFHELVRGQSSAYFTVKDTNGNGYPIFLKDALEVIKTVNLIYGSTPWLQWIVKKRGENYGIGLFKDEV